MLSEEITRLTHNKAYERHVFFIDNLGYIQKTDARKINLENAVEFEKLHKDIYQQFGYNLIHIPGMNIKKRTDYIINTLYSQRD